jgi:hypothetical protein
MPSQAELDFSFLQHIRKGLDNLSFTDDNRKNALLLRAHFWAGGYRFYQADRLTTALIFISWPLCFALGLLVGLILILR